MEIVEVFNSPDFGYVRAKNKDGRTLYVQRKGDTYYFEWSLDLEHYDNLEDVGKLDRPSAIVSRDSYDDEDVAEYVEMSTDLSLEKVSMTLHEMREFLEPAID